MPTSQEEALTRKELTAEQLAEQDAKLEELRVELQDCNEQIGMTQAVLEQTREQWRKGYYLPADTPERLEQMEESIKELEQIRSSLSELLASAPLIRDNLVGEQKLRDFTWRNSLN